MLQKLLDKHSKTNKHSNCTVDEHAKITKGVGRKGVGVAFNSETKSVSRKSVEKTAIEKAPERKEKTVRCAGKVDHRSSRRRSKNHGLSRLNRNRECKDDGKRNTL